MKINVYMGIFQGILHFYLILTLSKVKNEGGKRKTCTASCKSWTPNLLHRKPPNYKGWGALGMVSVRPESLKHCLLGNPQTIRHTCSELQFIFCDKQAQILWTVIWNAIFSLQYWNISYCTSLKSNSVTVSAYTNKAVSTTPNKFSPPVVNHHVICFLI
jgi:hypothetical protein